MRGRRGLPATGLVASGLAALGLAAAGLLACGKTAPDAPPANARPNVLLVVVDTLRADRLSAYGYGRATSPNFDRLAATGALFATAHSQATCTFPAVNSLLTSRYPVRFLGQEDGRMGVPDTIPTLAELLAARGWATAAVSASPVVRRSPSRFNPHGGFAAGFGSFDESCLWQAADCVNQRAAGELRELREPFFLYLHYMDPHGPYRPPATQRRRFAGAFSGSEATRQGDPNPLARLLYEGPGPAAVPPAEVAHLSDLYDDEVAYFDDQLPVLLAALDASGKAERTVLVLAADHGESFLEHGDLKHCRAPYGEELRTPLFFRVPGGVAGARIHGPASNLDIVPTLLELAAVPSAELALEGRSLVRWLSAAAPLAPPLGGLAFASQGPYRTVFDGRWKLLADLSAKQFLLFDLKADPGETLDLAGREPGERRRLEAALHRHLLAVEGDPAAAASLAAGAEAERRLKALGYLQ